MSTEEHMTQSATDRSVILDTGLFEDRLTLSAALQALNVPATDQRKLNPTAMNDGDWDEILSLVLSAKRVITL